MSDFSEVAFVWPGNSGADIQTAPYTEPVCSVAAWPGVLGCELLWWDSALPHTLPAERIRAHRIFLVNLFWNSRHVEQIKQVHPDAVVVAMPDPYLEMVLYSDTLTIWDQLVAADLIAGRTPADVELYGTLLDKPAVWLPSPIGPREAFEALWVDVEAKDDVVVAVEHHWSPRTEAPTIAALAALQRESGAPVEFYGASAKTQRLAQLAGLEVDCREKLPYPAFIARLARAFCSVDLYMAHAQGRHLMSCAMAGTLCVGSQWNNHAGNVAVLDPLQPRDAAAWPLLWREPAFHQRLRTTSAACVDDIYGFEASRERVADLLEGAR